MLLAQAPPSGGAWAPGAPSLEPRSGQMIEGLFPAPPAGRFAGRFSPPAPAGFERTRNCTFDFVVLLSITTASTFDRRHESHRSEASRFAHFEPRDSHESPRDRSRGSCRELPWSPLVAVRQHAPWNQHHAPCTMAPVGNQNHATCTMAPVGNHAPCTMHHGSRREPCTMRREPKVTRAPWSSSSIVAVVLLHPGHRPSSWPSSFTILVIVLHRGRPSRRRRRAPFSTHKQAAVPSPWSCSQFAIRRHLQRTLQSHGHLDRNLLSSPPSPFTTHTKRPPLSPFPDLGRR